MKRLAIVSTHPIQYNAPLFRLLAATEGLEIHVFYTWSQTSGGAQYDPKFGRVIAWDIPLLDGYDYSFVRNISPKPGSGHFRGIQNPDLVRRISDWKPSAVLVFGWSFQSHLACMRHFKGRLPVLFRGDSTLLDERPGFKGRLRRLFLRWVYRHVDIALYTGKANREYFKACGLADGQLVFAPHAVDNRRFGADHEIRLAEARQRRLAMGIREDDILVLFAGKFEEKKDPYFILELAKQVEDPGIRFLMVGNGALEQGLKQEASMNNRVLFMDFQNQQSMPVIYRMADVFLLPSVRNETWGLAVNEAMACRIPVMVSTKVGCAEDMVIEGQTGWTFTPGPVGAQKVAKLLRTMRANMELLHEAGERAYEQVSAYSYEAVVKAICAALGDPQSDRILSA